MGTCRVGQLEGGWGRVNEHVKCSMERHSGWIGVSGVVMLVYEVVKCVRASKTGEEAALAKQHTALEQ